MELDEGDLPIVSFVLTFNIDELRESRVGALENSKNSTSNGKMDQSIFLWPREFVPVDLDERHGGRTAESVDAGPGRVHQVREGERTIGPSV